MQEVITWGALAIVMAQLIPLIKMFTWIGGQAKTIETIANELKDARSSITTAVAKAEFAALQLQDFKLKVSEGFASQSALASMENRFTAAVEGMRVDFRDLAGRIDRVLDGIGDHRVGAK